MKSIVIIVALLVIAAIEASADTDIEDLGVITPKKEIVLEHTAERSDIRHFLLDFAPIAAPTNQIHFVSTNDTLRVDNLGALPSGPILMTVRTACKDGSVSAPRLYRFELWRAEPPAPRARVVEILGGEEERTNSIAQILETRRTIERSKLPTPPLPTDARRVTASSPIPPAVEPPRPLPSGTNKTYSEHLDSMARFYNKRRRNE